MTARQPEPTGVLGQTVGASLEQQRDVEGIDQLPTKVRGLSKLCSTRAFTPEMMLLHQCLTTHFFSAMKGVDGTSFQR
jgi:hypothetical protein